MSIVSKHKVVVQGDIDMSSPLSRITTLENNEYKVTYYEVIQGTSGTLVVPSQGTINSDEFGLSGNAILSKIDANGKPTYQSPTTSLGVAVTTSLDVSTGAWVVSGVYTDPNVAVIYSIRIKAIYYSNLTYNNIIETIDLAVTKTSQLINDGDDGVSHFISLEDLPSNLTLYATNVASDIPTYYKLVTTITDPSYNTTPVNIPTGAITTTGQLIAILATSANIIVGNPGIFNITTIGNIQKLSGTGNAEFYFEVWQRTLAGVETLITVSSSTLPVLNSGYAEFSASALWNNGSFLSTDRIVLKYYADRIVTGSDPTYQFQFGGLSPVRSLVPIPLNVVPVLKLDELQDVTIASVANNEILTYESSTSLWKNKSVVSALGFTPYNATNPSGYITSSSLTGLVPYTGATANVDLGTFTLTTPTINGVSGLLSFKTTDKVSVGNYATPSAQRIFTVGQDTGWLTMGSCTDLTSQIGIFLGQTSFTYNNAAIRGGTGGTAINTPATNGTIWLKTSGTDRFVINAAGGVTAFTFSAPNTTGAIASTAVAGWNYQSFSRQWATGAITTQSENVWGATTYSFVGASTITNAYGNVFNAPIAGTNATITNNWSAQFNGKVQINGNITSTGAIDNQYYLNIVNPNLVATAAARIQVNNGAAFSSVFSIGSNGDAVDPSMLYLGGSNKGILFTSNSVGVLKVFDATRNFLIQDGGTFTDAGFRLDVNGTTRITGNTTIGSTNQLIEIKPTATAPTYTQTGSSSSVFNIKAGTRTLAFESYAGDQNYFSSTGANFRIRTTDVQNIQFYTNSTQRFTIGSDGNFYITEPGNFIFGTTIGTKIGAGTTQKIGFWNATPIVQPATGGGASTFVSNTSLIANDTATFDGYTIGQVVKALRNMGLLA